MAKKKTNNKWNYLITLVGFIFLGTASWAFYSLINQGAGDLLLMVGIENVYAKLGIIIGVVFASLVIGGTGIVKSFERIAKK